MKRVAIFGSTGSIGTTTLRIIRENPKLFSVTTLVAGNNLNLLIEQIKEFHPRHVYIKIGRNARFIKRLFPDLDVYTEDVGLEMISRLEDADIAVSALVGIAGLEPTCNMLEHCKEVALANKEVLVTGGNLVMEKAKKYGTKLRTVDSEHSAIMQCLRGEESNKISKILLTASGGPFFDKREITDDITPEQALNHPNWKMGQKVTIDSATMMNKGFEVIEAHYLFGVAENQIQVVVHKQSLVHSMVQFVDGTIMANIGPTDMQIPIAYALNYPTRLENKIEPLDLFKVGSLKFEEPNLDKFKCLKLAYKAIQMGHSAQVVLNAADEVAVQAFLDGAIRFTEIPEMIDWALSNHIVRKLGTVYEVLELDKAVKKACLNRIS